MSASNNNRSRAKFWVAILLGIAVGTLVIVNRTTDHAPPPHTLGLHDQSPSAAEAIIAHGAHVAERCCMRCHGHDLGGGYPDTSLPECPLAPNLNRDGIGRVFTENDFHRVLREGLRPDGSPLNPIMPAVETRELKDDDIHALWLHSQSLPLHARN